MAESINVKFDLITHIKILALQKNTGLKLGLIVREIVQKYIDRVAKTTLGESEWLKFEKRLIPIKKS